MKIIDLAKDLIRSSVYELNIEMPIIITGIRPREKLFKELLLDGRGISMERASNFSSLIVNSIYVFYLYYIKNT